METTWLDELKTGDKVVNVYMYGSRRTVEVDKVTAKYITIKGWAGSKYRRADGWRAGHTGASVDKLVPLNG